MSVLDALDATRICARWSPAPDDALVWARPLPVPPRRVAPVPAQFSWVGLARNPHALLVTGMVGTVIARDFAKELTRNARRRVSGPTAG